MRVIFMGNPEFAVRSLEQLFRSNHKIIAVVTNPPKRMGRGNVEKRSALHDSAQSLNIPVIFAESLKSKSLLEQLQTLSPDLFCVVAYRILPKELLSVPIKGSINLHGSILPNYRGAAPIQRAIMNGDSQTGLTTFLLDNKVDTGQILLHQNVPISPEDNYGSLSEKMSKIGANLLLETVDKMENGLIVPINQDHEKATKASKIKSKEREIDWSLSSEKIHNHIRGITPIPGAFTTYKKHRFKIFKTEIISYSTPKANPGSIVKLTKTSMIIQTGEGELSILSLQREGKRRMEIEDFLKGSSLVEGEIFGLR